MERLTYTGKNGKPYVKDDGYYNHCRLSLDNVASRLAFYENAEQAGQLVIYPCKVGELVWLIDTRFFQRDKTRLPVICCLVDEFSSDGTHTYIVLDGAEPWYKMRRFRSVDITDFGRILFKTKQEAAAALARDIDVPCKKEG